MNDNTSIKIARLITLEKKFRTAENLSELGFVCANELRSVVDYNFLFFLLTCTKQDSPFFLVSNMIKSLKHKKSSINSK